MIHPIITGLGERDPQFADACNEIFTKEMAFIQTPKEADTYGWGMDFLTNPNLGLTLVHASFIDQSSGEAAVAVTQLVPPDKCPSNDQVLQHYSQTIGSYQGWAAGEQVAAMLARAQFGDGWAGVGRWTLDMLSGNDQTLRAAYIQGRDPQGNMTDLLLYPRLLFDQLGDLLAREIVTGVLGAEVEDLQRTAQEFRRQYQDFYHWTGAAAAAATLVVPERFSKYLMS